MKFLHTADWHIGRKLHGYSLLEEQKAVFEQLKELTIKEKVDAILLAGDIFDIATPPISATQALDQMLYELNVELGLPLFIVSGNHDGANRLQFGTRWMEDRQLYLATQLEQAFQPIEFADFQIFLLPFFHPGEARRYYGIGEEEKGQMETITQAMDWIVRDMEALIKPGKKPILVTHFYVSGQGNHDYERTSESKSEIGGLQQLPAHLFSKFAYVALGHLHSHLSSPAERVRYSGSLLKFAVDEVWQDKGVLLLDWEKEQLIVDFKPLKNPKDIRVLKGTFEELLDPDFIAEIQNEGPAYYSIHLTQPAKGIRNIRDQLQIHYPDLLEIRVELEKMVSKESGPFEMQQLEEPLDLMKAFFHKQTGQDLSDQQAQWLEEILLESEKEV